MFGMEKDKKGNKPKQGIFFELEKDIVKDPSKFKTLEAKIRENIQKLKDVLRSGAEKENYDKYGILLHGFASMQKVIGRVNKKAR